MPVRASETFFLGGGDLYGDRFDTDAERGYIPLAGNGERNSFSRIDRGGYADDYGCLYQCDDGTIPGPGGRYVARRAAYDRFFHPDNTALAGEVADNVKYSFYIGAFILLACVLWTIIRTKEYSPEEMAEFRLSGGESVEKRNMSNGFMEILHDIFHMPGIMLRLGLCQFFAWFALYSMWVYSTPALAEHVYGTTDPSSVEYAMAGDKVGELFSIYNFVAMLFALALIPIARYLGRKVTHAVCLCLGGLGLVSLYLLEDTGLMVFSMIGIGIAWASILAMPYAILSDSLPMDKMGTYMGIFNFFITIPQIVNGIIHGWIVRNVYQGHAVFALLTGGIFLFLAAASVCLVKEKRLARP